MTNAQLIELGKCDAYRQISLYILTQAAVKLFDSDTKAAEVLAVLAEDIMDQGRERRAQLDAVVRAGQSTSAG